jgi:hypothetical protein
MEPESEVRHRRVRRTGLSGWLVPSAFAAVAVPYLVALVRVLSSAGGRITLPDDLALIDLHVRRAMDFQQQLGVFDHNNWNHPGPAYFYLQSMAYRLLGSRPSTLFAGAVILSGLAAMGVVWVVLRRSSATRAVMTAAVMCWLGIILSAHSPQALTYSEGPLGALVSPWNPMVVIVPLLLLCVLGASAIAGSGLSVIGAALVASFVVQANISSGPLALGILGIATVGWVVALLRRRSSPVGLTRRTALLGSAAGVLLVLAWLPPLIEQVNGAPGNMTLIWRFFTVGHPGQTTTAALWTLVDVGATSVVGPSQVMGRLLGNSPPHAALGIAVLFGSVLASAYAVVVGIRQGRRFAAGLGVVSLLGLVILVISFTKVVGFVFGYLAIWGVVIPLACMLSVLMLGVPERWRTGSVLRASRVGLLVVTAVASVGFMLAAARTPATHTASDPQVDQLAALVQPHLDRRLAVEVNDAGAGTADTQLLDTERFIGLVNELERRGYTPKVNRFWLSQFGPGYLTDETEPQRIVLETWKRSSPAEPGYVGKVGDMAVFVPRAG